MSSAQIGGTRINITIQMEGSSGDPNELEGMNSLEELRPSVELMN